MVNKLSHSTNTQAKLKEQLRRIALDAGFDQVAFAAPNPPKDADKLTKWLATGQHGDMAWMEKNVEKRLDPKQLLANVGAIMVLGVNYRPPGDPSPYLGDPGDLGVSAYARNREYQETLKKKLKKLALQCEELLDRKIDGRIFVDTAPVMEKPMAAGAGLGWQGKNSLLVNRSYGCWLLLAEFFMDIDLPADPAGREHCGSCNRCQTACPTDALDRAWQLDASRCLAYFTIESAAAIPIQYRKAMGNRVFGCDDCLTSCPFNRFAPPTKDITMLPRPALNAPKLLEFAFLNDEQFRQTFSKSAVKRSGRVRFMRNLAVALGNWGSEKAFLALEHLFADEHPMIRGHAAWGLARNPHPKALALLKSQARTEQDATVLDEIRLAVQFLAND